MLITLLPTKDLEEIAQDLAEQMEIVRNEYIQRNNRANQTETAGQNRLLPEQCDRCKSLVSNMDDISGPTTSSV